MTLWTIAYQALLYMGFSRQEYWSGLPCCPPGNLTDLGIKPESLMSSAAAAAAAALAKSLQSCPTLCDPIDGSPPGSPIPGIKSLSRVRLLATPWTAAYQAPPSMGFSRQEYWSGLPLPSPKEGIRMANEQMKRCSPSHVTREMQIKTKRYHHTPIRMAKIRNTDKPKC